MGLQVVQKVIPFKFLQNVKKEYTKSLFTNINSFYRPNTGISNDCLIKQDKDFYPFCSTHEFYAKSKCVSII